MTLFDKIVFWGIVLVCLPTILWHGNWSAVVAYYKECKRGGQ